MDIRELDRIATRMLIALGFTPKNMGYYYIHDALMAAVFRPESLSLITKLLYPEIAANHLTSGGDVERSIRFAVREWYEGKTPGTRVPVSFSDSVTIPDTCPSNGQLLKLLLTPLLHARTLLLWPGLLEYGAPLC